MSQLKEEINSVVDAIIPKQPIYSVKIENNWRGKNIKLTCTNKAIVNSNSFISTLVKHQVVQRINFTTGVVTKHVRADALRDIRDKMTTEIKHFIVKYSNSCNPKLTALYKWYHKLNTAYFRILTELGDDEAIKLDDILFNIWKYIRSDTVDTKNCIKILKFIKTKYEPKLEIY